MTLLQDNHGDLHGQVVLVQDTNQMVEILVCLVLLELYLVLVVEVHGVMVQPQDQVVVLQVCSSMELLSLVLAVVVLVEDQVVVTTVVELLMVVILVVTHKDLHNHFLQ